MASVNPKKCKKVNGKIMSKIFVLMGKSAVGKDSLFKRLVSETTLSLKTAVSYTTRPIRSGEENGVEYFFVSEAKMQWMQKEGNIIESRCYHTIHGDWYYFTADDGQIDLNLHNYLLILTLEGYEQLCRHYKKSSVIPIYVELEDSLRLIRAINREKEQKIPKYSELCRRFLADEIDFSEENLKKARINIRYNNVDIDVCLHHIMQDIKKML